MTACELIEWYLCVCCQEEMERIIEENRMKVEHAQARAAAAVLGMQPDGTDGHGINGGVVPQPARRRQVGRGAESQASELGLHMP
jgi:hypothetical protein